MGYLIFYVAVIAACLFWSAACIAAAARTERTWLRRLLLVIAVLVPPLALAPWVGLTGLLAFGARLQVNWFAPTVTTCLASFIGGLWIRAAGLSRRPDASGYVAAAWPIVGLAAMFVMATTVSFGTLLCIDNAVVAEGRALRIEAAQLMAANLPPTPPADDDAAPLYLRAFAAMQIAKDSDSDTAGPKESPWSKPLVVDVAAKETTEFLARHADALALVRRAADTSGCRFVRDWSRPSFDLLLPEIQEMRKVANLLAVAARREAHDGDADAALRDIVRIRRVAMHTAAEPVLVCGLVGQAIDTLSLETLVSILPLLSRDDLPLLDYVAVHDFLQTPLSYQKHFLGEEAFGLATLADVADDKEGRSPLEMLRRFNDAPPPDALFGAPLAILFRCFMLPADIDGYRTVMRRWKGIVHSRARPTSKTLADVSDETSEIEAMLRERRTGIFSAMFAPALSGVLRSEARGQASHAAADVLVAVTRERLASGVTPETVDALVPGRLPVVPRDPFADGKPLIARRVGGIWSVYSVGPDGEDDGGPPAAGVQPPEGNDDVGLRLQVSAGTASDAP